MNEATMRARRSAVERPLVLEPDAGVEPLLAREWLVTNGLGGYSSSTIAGALTRRYHGLLVAALPAPLGRSVMLNHLWEEAEIEDGSLLPFGATESASALDAPSERYLAGFRLEAALPVWEYDLDGQRLEKRIVMPYSQNTVCIIYRLVGGNRPLTLRLQPYAHFRSYESPVSQTLTAPQSMQPAGSHRFELSGPGPHPPLQLWCEGALFVEEERRAMELLFRVEADRGYHDRGALWSPGYFRARVEPGEALMLVASTEPWAALGGLSPTAVVEDELARRDRLIELAPIETDDDIAAQLVMAADQFIITPATRAAELARARAAGDEARTIIAGYHWFTDWGRDTMIALEGLTLATGRRREAGYILRTFAHYVRDGLIPNMFPDHSTEGLYHTADATLWFFHAIDRYVHASGDTATLDTLRPVLHDIVRHHMEGTLFGIGVDQNDGLLRQGADGYQLTWMDAKVDGWVVTPRRGKAVEINALWYNALRLLEAWSREAGEDDEADALAHAADRAYASFNDRFWNEDGGYLYDVVDGEAGDDAALRPNQVFSISLAHPILEPMRWGSVMDTVERTLLTPYGLRSLAPGHADYKKRYFGDLRARDAAYHQGTVWAWLIGPFVDAWLRVHPERSREAHGLLDGLVAHLDDFGVGSVAEIFDAESPFTPRGCIAQAWSVAELLRCWVRTAPAQAVR
ncbi:MAG: amylo-alpha-1,6-glucosidase [Longimicrobiales bacterium]